MLVPAVLYKEEIKKKMQSYFYTKDMMYETGCLDNYIPDITDCPSGDDVQLAVVNDDNKLLGFINYHINYYASSASRFGIFSFDRGNPLFGKDIFNELERLIKRFHRVEWRMVGGNPVERSYDRFCFKHGGNKHIFKDGIRDAEGNYRDDILYEIVSDDH